RRLEPREPGVLALFPLHDSHRVVTLVVGVDENEIGSRRRGCPRGNEKKHAASKGGEQEPASMPESAKVILRIFYQFLLFLPLAGLIWLDFLFLPAPSLIPPRMGSRNLIWDAVDPPSPRLWRARRVPTGLADSRSLITHLFASFGVRRFVPGTVHR